ncbi:alpha/beta hydrolase [Anaplasma phagocytophilum]|uniref:Palmitoyl-protein thioesterase ABHD10, mitochondrial n=3 Tax=Anaplasma phagocytophilum TaxID=948 RepID=Q2GLF0_ANAPZ|nr:alpha/beta hydrolase [Anaplasma phagocytophilum]AGR78644.1 hydrolase [Anaplasma phagocytophilum str. HZ2]KJV88157.1 prolyl oligopeptidase family protein [Anaplasma phagocytophilum str. ApNYW]KJZ98803.1 prolyl oligopeptidase family protein [Anaplasma phagocytophilum str. CR1007]ABD44023.1 hydrolase, alpha/beta fold family [Anaplasma phagocytophilum str. HZ]AGR79891.1 hydrolase [Anaplasma phagocytophilum str. JM]
MKEHKIEYLKLDDGSSIAYQHNKKQSNATVVCMGGFSSEMHGAKGSALFSHCSAEDIDCIVFDYLGHGVSSGDFKQYSIRDWYKNCCHVIESLTQKPLILVGTSMGGWLMLRVAMSYASRIHGLVGFAPAPDFTETLEISAEEKQEIENTGFAISYVERMCGLLGLSQESRNATIRSLSKEKSLHILQTEEVTILKNNRSYTITPRLKEDSKNYLLLDMPEIPIDCDTVLIHSIADQVIPYSSSLSIAEKIRSKNVSVHLIKSSDHLLIDEQPLKVAYSAIRNFIT